MDTQLGKKSIIDPSIEHVIDTFARPLGMTTAELRQRMKLDREGQDYVVIKPDLSEDDAENLKQLARDYSISPSVVFRRVAKALV